MDMKEKKNEKWKNCVEYSISLYNLVCKEMDCILSFLLDGNAPHTEPQRSNCAL